MHYPKNNTFSEVLAKAKIHYNKGLPFVLYRRPKEHSINGLFQNDAALRHSANFTEEGFIFAPFDSNHPNVLIRSDVMIQAHDFTPVEVTDTDGIFPLNDTGRKKFHVELVEKGITAINHAIFEKVVLSRLLTVDTKKTPFDLFKALVSRYVNAYCYLWFHPKVGLWLGATPEILLKTEKNKFTTMSLAGTRHYIDKKDRPWGQKELSEQALVTQYIQRALEGVVSKLEVSKVESVRAGNLEHLRTRLAGSYKGNLMEIVNLLHPTPAVCGVPMSPARDFILEHENYDREFYTGFIGELNLRSTRFRSANGRNQENQAYRAVTTRTALWVNLRCMKLVNNKAFIYSGGGITKDSHPEKEWQETVEKSKTMLHILH